MNQKKALIYAALAGLSTILSYLASGGNIEVSGLAGAAVAAIGAIESTYGHESTP